MYIDLAYSINWRIKRGKVQLLCPVCDIFFNIPDDVSINGDGYILQTIYHFCNIGEKDLGWVVQAHLLEYNANNKITHKPNYPKR